MESQDTLFIRDRYLSLLEDLCVNNQDSLIGLLTNPVIMSEYNYLRILYGEREETVD